MPEINDALRGAAVGRDAVASARPSPTTFPNDEFKGKTVDYEVTLAALKEKKLPALDDEFAGAVAEGDTRRDAAREGPRTACATRRKPTAGASSAGSSSTRCSRGARSRRPEVLVESETIAALRDYARYLAAERRRPREGGLGEARRRGPPRGGEARPRVPAARRDRRSKEGIADHRDGARGRVQAGRRAARGRARRSCGSRWRRPAASKPCATRCAWPGPSTS